MKGLSEYIYEVNNIRIEDYLFEDFCLDNNINVSNISRDELIELYEDFETYKFFGRSFGSKKGYVDYEYYQDKLYDNIIYEDLQRFIKILKTEYGITDYEINNKSNKYICTIRLNKSFEYNSDDFKKLCKQCNVNIASIKKGLTRNNIQIEDIDTKDCTEEIYKKSNGILYHLTTKDRVERILKYGLEPRSENTKYNYPNRIYFISGLTNNKDVEFLNNILDKNNYTLLKINVGKLINKPKFFKDPMMDERIESYWTAESIPPFVIKVVQKTTPLKNKIISFTHQLYNRLFN